MSVIEVAAWSLVPLEQVVKHCKGFIRVDEAKVYKRCRVQMHAKGVVLRDIVSGAEIKTKEQQVCRAGEFLVAEIDAKVGGYGIVPIDLEGAIVSSHYFLFQIDEAVLDRQFLSYFIRTPAFSEQVLAQGSTNYAAIRPKDVLGYQIPLPPLTEQRRIVARIEELAAKVEEARGLRRLAVEETKRIWAYSAQQILNDLYEVRSEPLKNLVTIQGGGTPSKTNPFFWEGTIPWISPKDMKVRELYNSIDHISKEATTDSAAKLLSPGSVLIVVRGMILAHTVPSAILRVPATINQDMKALVPGASITPEYLSAVLWGLNNQFLELVEKSTHDTRKLETPKLLNALIPVPCVEEQRRIVAYLDDLQTKVDALKKLQAETAAELDALLPAILDRAFKGAL